MTCNAENLTSPHFHVMEPYWADRNEEFLVTPDMLEDMAADSDQIDALAEALAQVLAALRR